MSVLSPRHRATVAVFALGAYLQLVEWVDLFPWNDVRRGNGQGGLDLALAALTILLVLGLWRESRVAAFATVVATGAWGALQVSTWWIPYFAGASDSWNRTYQRWFAQTIQVLPREPGHLPPDANHIVLQALIGVTFVAALAASLSEADRMPRPGRV